MRSLTKKLTVFDIVCLVIFFALVIITLFPLFFGRPGGEGMSQKTPPRIQPEKKIRPYAEQSVNPYPHDLFRRQRANHSPQAGFPIQDSWGNRLNFPFFML